VLPSSIGARQRAAIAIGGFSFEPLMAFGAQSTCTTSSLLTDSAAPGHRRGKTAGGPSATTFSVVST
jgi:hypothetical protein